MRLLTAIIIILVLEGVVWYCLPKREVIRQVTVANPYSDIQPFMQGLYAVQNQESSENKIRAVIVPHHLVASQVTASGIQSLVDKGFNKIILVSPDHFNRCSTLVCTSDVLYQTYFGEVVSDSKSVQNLLLSPLSTNSPELFDDEHGLHAVVPFIAKIIPDAQIVPVVLSQNTRWRDNWTDLADLLASIMDDETAIVVSSDFSHYRTLEEANQFDESTKAALVGDDLEAIANLANPDQSDCPNCLLTLKVLAQKIGFDHPEVLLHTNSAELLDNKLYQSTTSHFCIIWCCSPYMMK